MTNTTCANGDLRLEGGAGPGEGRVEMCYDNQWGMVCGHNYYYYYYGYRYYWDSTDAGVVCRQLGFFSGGMNNTNTLPRLILTSFTELFACINIGAATYYDYPGLTLFSNTVECSGDESKLIDCIPYLIVSGASSSCTKAGVNCLGMPLRIESVRMYDAPVYAVGAILSQSQGTVLMETFDWLMDRQTERAD